MLIGEVSYWSLGGVKGTLIGIASFSVTSKGLDGRTVQIHGWRDFEVIEELLRKCTPSKKKTFKVLKKVKISN